jgi:hypothetical protein
MNDQPLDRAAVGAGLDGSPPVARLADGTSCRRQAGRWLLASLLALSGCATSDPPGRPKQAKRRR